MSTYKTVKIKKYSDIIEEYTANAAITPGHLIEEMSTGKVRVHANAGKDVTPPMFALEDELQGGGIDTAYSAGNRVQCWIPGRGDQVYALLADGEIVVVGDALVSAGDGTLKKDQKTYESWESADANPGGGQRSIYTNRIVGIALEAKNLKGSGSDSSAGGAYYPRIKVRIV